VRGEGYFDIRTRNLGLVAVSAPPTASRCRPYGKVLNGRKSKLGNHGRLALRELEGVGTFLNLRWGISNSQILRATWRGVQEERYASLPNCDQKGRKNVCATVLLQAEEKELFK